MHVTAHGETGIIGSGILAYARYAFTVEVEVNMPVSGCMAVSSRCGYRESGQDSHY